MKQSKYSVWKCCFAKKSYENPHQIPKDKQVLFHSEALGAEVPPAAFTQATRPTWFFLWVTVQLWELHQFIVFKGVVMTGLLPDPRGVDHQRLLQNQKGNETGWLTKVSRSQHQSAGPALHHKLDSNTPKMEWMQNTSWFKLVLTKRNTSRSIWDLPETNMSWTLAPSFSLFSSLRYSFTFM